MGGRRVVVVTGGGAGIGAAIAEELGRRGDHVVTMDPLVTLDGTERLPPAEETTAGRIVAAGGAAEASAVSVTDGEAVSDLFSRLVADHGRLDAVINVAGITRSTSFATGTEEDWSGVLTVHLEGYLNVLAAALPLMAAAGSGRILGVTSGSGWRPADAGAYACAKRAVAALTWTLGPIAPPGVTVNALSPIAVTRMVIEAARKARERAATGAAGPTSGGMSFGRMPEPHELGPVAAHLVGDELSWCRGRVVFAGGPEVAVVEPPRLLEVVRTGGVASLAAVLDALVPKVFAPAEAQQVSGGGGNPRFAALFAEPPADVVPSDVGSCLLVSDRAVLASGVEAALGARGVACTIVGAETVGAGFGARPGACRLRDRSMPSSSPGLRRRARPGPGAGSRCWPSTPGSPASSSATPPGRGRSPTMRRARSARCASSPSPTRRPPGAGAGRRPWPSSPGSPGAPRTTGWPCSP